MIKERRLEPPEERTRKKNITICIEYKKQIDIPEEWDSEDIEYYIHDNLDEIISDSKSEVILMEF